MGDDWVVPPVAPVLTGHVVQLETNSRDGLQLGVDQALITLQCA